MVVDSMTDKEIINEILNDWYTNAFMTLQRKLLAKDNYYRRTIMKSNRHKPIFFPKIEYVSPRNNKFVIVPYSIGWSDYKKRGMLHISYAEVSYRGNRRLLHLLHEVIRPLEYHVHLITYHCLERYNERFFGSSQNIDEDFYIKFMLRNSLNKYEILDTPKGKSENMISGDGIFLVEQIEGNNYIYKTYISDNEYYPNQREAYNKGKYAIKRYIEENHLMDLSQLAS